MKFYGWFFCSWSTIVSRYYSLAKKRHLIWRQLLLQGLLLIALSLHIIWIHCWSATTHTSIYFLRPLKLARLNTLSKVNLIIISGIRFWVAIINILLRGHTWTRAVVIISKHIIFSLKRLLKLRKLLLEALLLECFGIHIILSHSWLFVRLFLCSAISSNGEITFSSWRIMNSNRRSVFLEFRSSLLIHLLHHHWVVLCSLSACITKIWNITWLIFNIHSLIRRLHILTVLIGFHIVLNLILGIVPTHTPLTIATYI